MSAGAFLRITRPHNAVVAGFAAVLGYLIATGTLVPPAALLAVAVILITAGGNVINDVFDVEIDRINRPERPIPAGEIGLSGARRYAGTLFVAGILVSMLTNALCLAFAVVNSLILVVYAARLKRVPFLGNAAVAYLVASIFLFGGAFAGIEGLVRNLPLASITFLATVARELLKDGEDVDGDTVGGVRTLPMIIGVRRTGWVAFACACAAAAASFIPIGRWWSPFYLAAIGLVDVLILAAAWKGAMCATPRCVRDSKATQLLRAGMFSALAVFTVAAVI